MLTDNRQGLVVNARASTADGYAERGVAATMLADVCRPDGRVTVVADRTTTRVASSVQAAR